MLKFLYILFYLAQQVNLDKELRIDTLAQISYMSRNKLQTCFKDYFGYTIMDYIRIKRLQNAQLLLESTELDVKEIALLCGYRNSSRFSKLFYIQTNMLPRQYRNYIKKGDICDVK
ncbi:helix-turn-helix transcriptional regulator [Blautia wexlerae]|uniref:helix-turn-helix domain-containing protein n=2 Tax=Blautia wexlerae TaxID=418240 RepID=UPI00232B9C31|nr:helix-turn-helix transcriptional regulator [Blautia wexlerae]MDB6487204.1 helix-turn-helix transcriptional regulator [Blautia wexlerae]